MPQFLDFVWLRMSTFSKKKNFTVYNQTLSTILQKNQELKKKMQHFLDKNYSTSIFQVRGAPAIGIAALLSLAVELTGEAWDSSSISKQALVQWATQKLDYLVTSRPTGVNLKIECAALKGTLNCYVHIAIFTFIFLFTRFH